MLILMVRYHLLRRKRRFSVCCFFDRKQVGVSSSKFLVKTLKKNRAFIYPAGYAMVPVVGEHAKPALDKMVNPRTRSR